MGFWFLVVRYLFCTMIMAIQSEGYTCFPIRSLKSRNDSIRKSCRNGHWKETMCVSIRTNRDFCRCVQVCTHHQIGGSSESLYVCRIVAIIHLTEYGCHARYDSRLHNCEHRRKSKEQLGSGDIQVVRALCLWLLLTSKKSSSVIC